MTIDEAMNGNLGRALASRNFTDGKREACGYSPSKNHRFHALQRESEQPQVVYVPETGGGGIAVNVLPSDTVWNR